MAVIFSDNVAYLSKSGTSVFMGSGTVSSDFSQNVASPIINELQEKLNVAPWGEDNRFPQNIEKHISYCGVAKGALNLKAKAMWGSGGIVFGTVEGYDENGNEIFKQAKTGDFPDVDEFLKRTNLPRYYAETNLDYVYFANTFTEAIFSKDRTKITRLVAQESCDCRFKRMDDYGKINEVYISKMWGMAEDQFVKFDPSKKTKSLISNAKLTEVDNKFLMKRFSIDIYNPQSSIEEAAKRKEKSFIIPVNYPSPNKTYYQLAHWDGARLSGWIEIASKIPGMIKSMYENGMTLRCHVQIPDKYFEKRAGEENWGKLDLKGKQAFKENFLQQVEDYLSGSENAYKTFISYFDVDPVSKEEYNLIKITPLEFKSQIDKDLLTSGTANSEIFFAMELNPNLLGAGQAGGVYGSNQGGSNIREANIALLGGLHLDRQMTLEPLNIVRDFNGWDTKIQFRHKDILMTTLDTGKQTEQKIN